MKIYSLLLICMTLGVFYGLAVNEENNRNHKNAKSHATATHMEKELTSEFNQFSPVEDEFANHVTGKEHIYLNIGISYMEEEIEPLELMHTNPCIAQNSTNETEANLGS